MLQGTVTVPDVMHSKLQYGLAQPQLNISCSSSKVDTKGVLVFVGAGGAALAERRVPECRTLPCQTASALVGPEPPEALPPDV